MESDRFYSSFGCRYPMMSAFQRVSDFDNSTTSGNLISDSSYHFVAVGNACSIASADLIEDVFQRAQIGLIIVTLPAVFVSTFVIYKKLKFEYEAARNDWKVMMQRATVIILINATFYTYTHLLWSINPNWANDTYGTIPCALLRIIPPVSAFNMICAYIYRFQATLNELISRSANHFKIFSITSSVLFFFSTVILVSFEIAVKDSTVPMLIWSTFFLIYSLINLAFGTQVVRALHKTENELKKMSRFTMARSLVLKAMSITFGLSIAGLVFFSPYMLDSWGKLLDPSKKLPKFLKTDEIQADFVSSVIMYQAVATFAEYSFYLTQFSCKRTTEMRSAVPHIMSNVVSTTKV